jgi:hypothetical protein
MTHHDFTHGKAGEGVTATSGSPNKGSPDAAGFDLFKLDCIADRLIAGAPLTRDEQHELRRVIENLTPLMETFQ